VATIVASGVNEYSTLKAGDVWVSEGIAGYVFP